jgi:hypothetical protein
MIILFCACLVAIFFLVGAKDKSFGRDFIINLPAGLATGDLYNYAEVADFNQLIAKIYYQNNNSLADSQILLFGDSFFRVNFESQPLPIVLEKVLGMKTFFPAGNVGVLNYLQDNNYQNKEAKIAVVEVVERNINSFDPADVPDSVSQGVSGGPVFHSQLTNFVFGQADTEYFIKNNYFIKPLRLWFKQLAYKYFGDINSSLIGLYSRRPPMLFYADDINFNSDANNVSSKHVYRLAEQIAKLKQELQEKYGLQMIFVVVPNKYSIYHDDVNGDPGYNNFIPLLQDELKKQKVDYVDLYGEFNAIHEKDSQYLLYYPSDTHYTTAGKMILVNDLAKKIKDYLK